MRGRAVALVLGVLVSAACGRGDRTADDAASPSRPAGSPADMETLRLRAQEERLDAEETQTRADAKRDEGDRHLAAGALAEARIAFLSRNAHGPSDAFGLPTEQVVEIGTQLDL